MTAVRLFGKLPAHGDFVSRGFNASERDSLDAWLATSLSDARDALGDEAFADRYDSAPPWRCVVPGDADGATAGALAPSIDAAGRRYPIFLALDVDRARALDAADRCEALLYDALAARWDADTVVAHAAAVQLADSPDYEGSAKWWTLGGEGFAPADLAGGRPTSLMRALLERGEEPA